MAARAARSNARTTTNPIDVIENAYELQQDDRAWLANLAQRVYPLLDGGLGMFTYRYDLEKPPTTWVPSSHLIDMTDDALQNVAEMLQVYSAADTNAFQTAPAPLSSLSGGVARRIGVADPFQIPRVQQIFKRVGAQDICALRTIETGTRGIVFCALQRERRTFGTRTRSTWAKVSVHLAAARRLRDEVTRAAAVEAVLTPAGRVEHAEGETKTRSVRDLLRSAVLHQERARGQARRKDPTAATEMWTSLVSGRWSLVDQFESNGRRLIVARRNELGCEDPRALGPRERDVVRLAALGKSNKLIGYELGLAESTVGALLSAAMRKLGAKSRVDLVQIVSGLSGR